MSTITKEYNVAAGLLRFKFYYADWITVPEEFHIVDISPLEYGYDLNDSRSIAVYPSNIRLKITDFGTDNYDKLRTYFANYRVSYPFDNQIIFTLTIQLNGVTKFYGYIDEIDAEYNDGIINLTFVDGINTYKDLQVYNPYFLRKLFLESIIPRSQSYIGEAYGYGFGFTEYINNKGYRVGSISTGDKDSTMLTQLIDVLVKSLNEEMTIEIDNTMKYGKEVGPLSDFVNFDRLFIRDIMQFLFGRYLVIKKLTGYINSVHYNSNDPEYAKTEYFQKVYENDSYLVYQHTWSGTYGNQRYEKGIDEKNITDILKAIARNTFSYFGIKQGQLFFFRHKRFKSQSIELKDIESISKSMTTDRVNYVEIIDYFEGNSALRGQKYSDTDNISYKIFMNAFFKNFAYVNRLFFYPEGGGNRINVNHFYDPEIGYRGGPMDVIAECEYRSNKNFLDQYDVVINGVGHEFDQSYKVDYDNYQGILRPITLSEDFLLNKTQMSAIEL